jgi:hypothetical protein
VKTWISFTNLIADTRNAMSLVVLKRSVIKKRKKIEEIEEFYEIFIFISNIFDFFLNTLIIINFSRKKLVT